MMVGSIAHASVTAAVKFHAVTDIASDVVRLGDIADLSPLPPMWQRQAANLAVARLRGTDSRTVIESARLAENARRQMPAIAPWLQVQNTQAVVIVKRSSSLENVPTGGPGAEPPPRCLELLRDVAQGNAIALDSVRAVACPREAVLHRAHYDEKSRLARAAADLAHGELLPSIATQRLAQVSRGEQIRTMVQTGAITVTRTGTALTDGAHGRITVIAAGNRDIVAVPATVSTPR
ncbi:flagella basal body P-ring formation protein FlgA [Paraburkholderia metrosideri]|nr:flagella basal body P-ring formation protein FlgA [Paraburkholderia metrosideri]